MPPRYSSLIVMVVVVSCAAAPRARAQIAVPPAPAPIVESHPPPLQAPAKKLDSWTSKAEVSYVATNGNVETTTAKVGAETQYKPDGWSVFLRGAFLTNKSEANGNNYRVDGLLRGSRAIGPRLEMFGQVVYLRNTFSGISHSVYPLGGVAYDVVASVPHSLKARVGLGYGQENRLRQPSLSFGTADAETAYRWALSKTAELRQDAAFTTNLSRGADWRFANVASVAASLSPMLSLKVSHSLNYLNEPVTGFERWDTVSAAALVATF